MDFHDTQFGHRFFEYQLPQLMASLSSIAKEMKRSNDATENNRNKVIDEISEEVSKLEADLVYPSAIAEFIETLKKSK